MRTVELLSLVACSRICNKRINHLHLLGFIFFLHKKKLKNEKCSFLSKEYAAKLITELKLCIRFICFDLEHFLFVFIDDESSSDNGLGKWLHGGAAHRKRNRPLPLPSTTSPAGAVDMADLVKLVTDLSNHIDSWPFLKPVTRAEVDYYFILHRISLSASAFTFHTAPVF